MNDVYIMRRLSAAVAARVQGGGSWPDAFDRYETLLQIGRSHGHAARFADASSALPIAIDLIGQRPEITDAEIASLVNLSVAEVVPIARHARLEILSEGYPYPWKPR